MVLAPQRDRSDRAFDGIVVELDTAVVQEMTEGGPAGKGVTDRVGEATAARNATKLRLEPRLHCLDKRPRLGIAHAPALFGSAPPYRLLDRIELGDAAQSFRRDWRAGRFVNVKELAPCVCPTGRQHDVATLGQPLESGVTVNLQVRTDRVRHSVEREPDGQLLSINFFAHLSGLVLIIARGPSPFLRDPRVRDLQSATVP